MRYGFKNAEEVKEASLKYNLHSWSVQGKLNPAVVEKARVFITTPQTARRWLICQASL